MADERTRTDEPLSEDLGPLRRAGRIRTAVLILLGVALVAGLLGVFDPKEGSTSAVGGGYELDAEFPTSARAGIGSPLTITVFSAGGFEGEELQVAITKSWLDLFQSPELQPEPSSATGNAERVIWTFDAPPGDTLEISSALTLEPALSGSESARLSVVDSEGQELVGLDLDTNVIP